MIRTGNDRTADRTALEIGAQGLCCLRLCVPERTFPKKQMLYFYLFNMLLRSTDPESSGDAPLHCVATLLVEFSPDHYRQRSAGPLVDATYQLIETIRDGCTRSLAAYWTRGFVSRGELCQWPVYAPGWTVWTSCNKIVYLLISTLVGARQQQCSAPRCSSMAARLIPAMPIRTPQHRIHLN